MKARNQIKNDKHKNIFNIKSKKGNFLKYNYNNFFNQQKKGEIKSINNNYESEEIHDKKIKIVNSQNNDNANSFYFNNKINYLSQGNSSSLEFVKSKNKNKSHNINNHENKDLFLMNKYSPGYIYYKAYQNIIEKLNKKKILSGRKLFKKNIEKKIINNKKRYKSGTINKLYISKNNNNNNYKTSYIFKNNNYKSSKKGNPISNDTNYNHIFSKTYKSSFIDKNIYSILNNKNNPYSIHWANKLLNINDVYLGVSYNSSVPLLKSLNLKKCNNKKCPPLTKSLENNEKKNDGTDRSFIKIKTNKMNISKLKIKCDNEERKNENHNQTYKKEKIINELKENSINMENINNEEDKKILKEKNIESQQIINNDKNFQKEANKEQANKVKDKEKNDLQINGEKNESNKSLKNETNEEENKLFEKKINKDKKEKQETENDIQKSVHDFTELIFFEAKADLENNPQQEEKDIGEKEEDKNKKENNDEKINFNDLKKDNDEIIKKDKESNFEKNNEKKETYEKHDDALNYIQILNSNASNHDLSENSVIINEDNYSNENKSKNDDNKSNENKSEKEDNKDENPKQFAKIFENNIEGDKNDEEDISIDEDIEKQFNTNQKNFFKFRKDIKEVSENLEDDEENKNI